MPLDLNQVVTFNLPMNVTSLEPNTDFVFTAERYEGHPTTLYLIVGYSEDKREHLHLDGLGASCEFYNGRYRCRWVDDNRDDGHLKDVTLELTRIK